MEGAQKKRSYQCGIDEQFDPVQFIEQTLPKEVKGFDYHYVDDDDPVFGGHSDRLAVVSFDRQPMLIARASVVDAAYRGDASSRFVLCHEIAHVFLHKREVVELHRHAVGSSNQYSRNVRLELEANAYAGALVAPPDGISILMSNVDVRRKYCCSSDVANKAITDASLWRKQQI